MTRALPKVAGVAPPEQGVFDTSLLLAGRTPAGYGPAGSPFYVGTPDIPEGMTLPDYRCQRSLRPELDAPALLHPLRWFLHASGLSRPAPRGREGDHRLGGRGDARGRKGAGHGRRPSPSRHSHNALEPMIDEVRGPGGKVVAL